MKKTNKKNTNLLEREISLLGGSKIKVWYALFIFVLGIATVSLLSQEVGNVPVKFSSDIGSFARTSITGLSGSNCSVDPPGGTYHPGDIVDIKIKCDGSVSKAYYFWEGEGGQGTLREVSGNKNVISYVPKLREVKTLYVLGRKSGDSFVGGYDFKSDSIGGSSGGGGSDDDDNNNNNNNNGGSGGSSGEGGCPGSGGEDDGGGGSGGSVIVRTEYKISGMSIRVSQAEASSRSASYYHGPGNYASYSITSINAYDSLLDYKEIFCGWDYKGSYFNYPVFENSGPDKFNCVLKAVDPAGNEVYRAPQRYCTTCECDQVTGSLRCSLSTGNCGLSCDKEYCASSNIIRCESLENKWTDAVKNEINSSKYISNFSSGNRINIVSPKVKSINCGTFMPCGCQAVPYLQRYHSADCTAEVLSPNGTLNEGEYNSQKCIRISFNAKVRNDGEVEMGFPNYQGECQ